MTQRGRKAEERTLQKESRGGRRCWDAWAWGRRARPRSMNQEGGVRAPRGGEAARVDAGRRERGAPRPAPRLAFYLARHPPACLRPGRAPWGLPGPQTKSRPEWVPPCGPSVP